MRIKGRSKTTDLNSGPDVDIIDDCRKSKAVVFMTKLAYIDATTDTERFPHYSENITTRD